MYTDMFGIKRAKVALHIHTNCSDGKLSPEDAVKYYREAGFDMMALTDHWFYRGESEIDGMPIIAGCEYNLGDARANEPVYHIVGLGMECDPTGFFDRNSEEYRALSIYGRANMIIKAIRKSGGLADLAHPAWSLNDTVQINKLKGIEATEIYNTVSECGMSDRPYSGCVIDSAAKGGKTFPLLAVDDVHYYADDACVAYVMVEMGKKHLTQANILKAIRARKFYATQGPEIHLSRDENGVFTVNCSPASKIVFFSNADWAPNRVHRGDGITEAKYTPLPGETFMRAEVTDENGKKAWSNIIEIK